MNEIPTLEHQQNEITAALDAHLFQAQAAIDAMKNKIENSKKIYAMLNHFRRRVVVMTMLGKKHTVYALCCRIVWAKLLHKLRVVLVADYQMVCSALIGILN